LKGTTEIFYTGIASITMSLSGVNSPTGSKLYH